MRVQPGLSFLSLCLHLACHSLLLSNLKRHNTLFRLAASISQVLWTDATYHDIRTIVTVYYADMSFVSHWEEKQRKPIVKLHFYWCRQQIFDRVRYARSCTHAAFSVAQYVVRLCSHSICLRTQQKIWQLPHTGLTDALTRVHILPPCGGVQVSRCWKNCSNQKSFSSKCKSSDATSNRKKRKFTFTFANYKFVSSKTANSLWTVL